MQSLVIFALLAQSANSAMRLEDQLYEDLLYAHNKVALPVKNSTDILTIKFGAALIRIIDVQDVWYGHSHGGLLEDEKNQILTTNVWLEMQWTDYKLSWDPNLYKIKKLRIPSDLIWTPDIVLYNNAAGDYDITILADAVVYYDGTVVWKPPAIYKSFCSIDVTWFPYDSQECYMKFGLWSYTGFYVDMRQLPEEDVVENEKEAPDGQKQIVQFLEQGMDLSYFYQSAEWDLLRLISERHEVIYTSCCGPEKYVDITYYFSLRRKTLFFTVNLIIPCFLISFLTTFVFYLSDHKITFAISILVTLTVFFLVLIDIIPPTSLVIPMFGRYLMTTMILVTVSVIISVVSVNFHFRTGEQHRMPRWVRNLFLKVLPKRNVRRFLGLRHHIRLMKEVRELPKRSVSNKLRMLWMKRPLPHLKPSDDDYDMADDSTLDNSRPSFSDSTPSGVIEAPPPILTYYGDESPWLMRTSESWNERQRRIHKQVLLRVLQHVRFIAEHFKKMEDEEEIGSDWTFVAMVIDRLFLIIFSFLNIGALIIILQAPTLYDTRSPLSIPPPLKPLGQDTLGPLYE